MLAFVSRKLPEYKVGETARCMLARFKHASDAWYKCFIRIPVVKHSIQKFAGWSNLSLFNFILKFIENLNFIHLYH